jgi:fatty acid desaturase
MIDDRDDSEDRDDPAQRDAPAQATEDAPDERIPRPMIERIGLALIALVMAAAFGGVAIAAWVGGQPFLAVMGAVGCLMTVWVGGLTVLRG